MSKKAKRGYTEIGEIKSEKTEGLIAMLGEILGERMEDKPFSLDNVETTMVDIFRELQKKTVRNIVEEQDYLELNCPDCGAKMNIKEKRNQSIKGLVNYEYERRTFVCPSCNHIERPLDKTLNCEDGYSLELKKSIVLLGKNMPFEEASDLLEKILKVKVSPGVIRNMVENVGVAIAKDEEKRVAKIISFDGYAIPMEAETKKIELINDVAYLQMDGSMVQTREFGWKEVKNGMLFTQKNVAQIDKHHRLVLAKKYFSEFNNGDSSLKKFLDRATQECYDFKFHNYKRQAIIADGAIWIWDYASGVHPDAIQILDYYHSAEYLGAALQAINFQDEVTEKEQRKKLQDQLWEGEIRSVISYLEQQTQVKAITDCIRYYENNIERMDYGKYRKMGLDIGSGAIESAHRIIVQKRMKQSGMHWGKDNVQSIISLRSKYLSGQWGEIVSTYLKKAA